MHLTQVKTEFALSKLLRDSPHDERGTNVLSVTALAKREGVTGHSIQGRLKRGWMPPVPPATRPRRMSEQQADVEAQRAGGPALYLAKLFGSDDAEAMVRAAGASSGPAGRAADARSHLRQPQPPSSERWRIVSPSDRA